MKQTRYGLLCGLLVYTIALRWFPYILQNCDVTLDPTITYYPWSFSPLTAVCLLCGASLLSIELGVLLPLLALFISDLGIGFLTGHWEWAFPAKSWWLTYVSFSTAVLLGTLLRRRGSKHRLVAAVGLGLLFEVSFFFVSNFAVWALSTTTYSPHTLSGLLTCLIAGIPFFRWSPISTALFTLLIFGPLGAYATNEQPAPSNGLVPAPAK